MQHTDIISTDSHTCQHYDELHCQLLLCLHGFGRTRLDIILPVYINFQIQMFTYMYYGVQQNNVGGVA